MTFRPHSLRSVALVAGLLVAFQLASPAVARAATTSSTLSLHATPSSARVGDQIDLTGRLLFDDTSSSADQTISLTKDDATGTHAVSDVTTDSDGSYSATDTVDVHGTTTYHAVFNGTGAVDGSNAMDTVSVTKRASHVLLKVSATAVRFGTSVHLTAHLRRGTDSRVVGIYAKPDGGNEKVIRMAKVDRHRDLHATFTPSKDTTFIARYDGDAAHRASHDDAVTRVRVIVHAKLTKAVARSGRYHIYRHGAQAPCLVRVVPNHKGFSVRATLQLFAKGQWRKSATKSFRLNASSLTGFAIRGTSNTNFRVHVTLPTHHDHLGDTSPWLYLRFR